MGQWDDKFEQAEKKWASWNMHDYSQTERVLSSIIEDKARKNPDHVVFQFRDDPLTLGDMNDRINQAANGFTALGIGHGDKVAIMLPNCEEFLYAWFGLNKIGAVEVPINVALKGAGLIHQIVQSDSVALVFDTMFMDRLGPVLEDLTGVRHMIYRSSDQTPPNCPGFETLSFPELMGHSTESPDVIVRYDDMASILYTSGTTGVSKGVMISHYYWYDIWSQAVQYAHYTDNDVLYTGLPFFHGNAQGITIGPAILADAKAVIVDRFSASALWNDCRKWGCTEANYIGGIIPILMKTNPEENDGDNPLRLMVGAAAPVDIWHEFESRFNTRLLEVYGMTECYCCLVNPMDETRPGSCGKEITGWNVKLVDDDDNEVAPGELGEFIAQPQGPFIGTIGYYGKPQETLELFKNHWIHTGDLGRMDEDRYFYFVDRKKQALRRRGENISSFEVEAVINSNPAVLESCVVGVPSDVGEEDVKAVVVLKEGCQLTEAELIEWCVPRQAYFAIPRYIAFRTDLPKTASERVEKYKLKNEGVTDDCWDREAAGIVLER